MKSQNVNVLYLPANLFAAHDRPKYLLKPHALDVLQSDSEWWHDDDPHQSWLPVHHPLLFHLPNIGQYA